MTGSLHNSRQNADGKTEVEPPLPPTIEERLARALRIHRFGLIRPLWEDMHPGEREIRTDDTSKLIKLLKRHGIDVVKIDGYDK